MSISAWHGPLVSFGQAISSDSNPELGPSAFIDGAGYLDPRPQFIYKNGQDFGSPTYVLPGFTDISVVDAAPSTAAVANIAASQTPAAAALTLVTSTAAGITVGVVITNQATGQPVTVLAIDGAMTPVTFGSSGTMCIWDPTKAIARNIRITSGGNDSGITFLVSGFDLYGFPMTETITGASAGIAAGKKAFKYILSITPSAAVASTASVGTGDVFGFPLQVNKFAYISLYWNNVPAATQAGIVYAVTTNPSTSLLGDVRGTIDVTNAGGFNSASNGTIQLQVFVTPSVANMGSITGLFGVTQA